MASTDIIKRYFCLNVSCTLHRVVLNQNRNAVFIWSVEMCFIFLDQIKVIFTRPLYEAVIWCDYIIKHFIMNTEKNTENKSGKKKKRKNMGDVVLQINLKRGLYGSQEFIQDTNELGHEKMCLMSYANNKGADQPVHPRSLISTFVVCWLDSIISLDSLAKISRP